MARRTNAGFSLLEALVALVILAGVGMALFELLIVQIRGLDHVNRVTASELAKRNALAYIEHINPMLRPQGSVGFEDYAIRWTSEAIFPLRDSVAHPAGTGLYQVGLYRLDVVIEQGRERIADFTVRQVGYQQVRQMEGAG